MLQRMDGFFAASIELVHQICVQIECHADVMRSVDLCSEMVNVPAKKN